MSTGIPVILDTDMDTDCDDVGALAMLHQFNSMKKVDIQGVICSAPTRWGARFIQQMNCFYERAHLPVGQLSELLMRDKERFAAYFTHVSHMKEEMLYNRYSTGRASEDELPTMKGEHLRVQESTALYRKLLARQAEKSVVICAIGTLTALGELLQSEPDDYSNLNGYQLVQQKVKLLVSMGGGVFPKGKDRFNWYMDPQAAELVLNQWPSVIAVSSAGEDVMTGAGLVNIDECHPLRSSYERFLGGAGRSRSSWDQIALLYAVYGATGGFTEHRGYRIYYDAASYQHIWTPCNDDPSNNVERVWIEPNKSASVLAQEIEWLMMGNQL